MGHISSSQKVVRQFGVSLIEVLLVLCVIGAGAAIAYIVGNKRIQASQADKAQLALTQISKSIEGVASTNLNYAMLSTAPTNAIPVSLIEADGHLKPSPWGAIALSTNSGAKAHESYSIAFSDVPPYGCVTLASKGYDGFATVEINGTVAWQSGGSAPDPAALSTACQQSVNVVKFTSPKLKGEWVASNPFIRTVYPPSGICLPPKFWNTITGTCDTPSTTCTPPQIWDAASSSCKTPVLVCTPPQYLASTAAGVVCVGPGACVLPKVWDAATSSCITPPVVCTPPQVFDVGTGACITPPVVCTPPQVWDMATSSCITPPVTCTPPQVWDAATSSCITPSVVCVPPQVKDAATNTCVTPPTCLPTEYLVGTECRWNGNCSAACVGDELAESCPQRDGSPNIIRVIGHHEGTCGWTAPAAGTLLASTCSNGVLIKTVSSGPGLGYHYEYGTC